MKERMDGHIAKHQDSLQKMKKKKVMVLEEDYLAMMSHADEVASRGAGRASEPNPMTRRQKAAKKNQTPSKKEEIKMEMEHQ